MLCNDLIVRIHMQCWCT